MSVTQTIRTALAQLDADMVVTSVKTMDQIAVESMTQSRTETGLIGGFALVALGIYGVMSYSVAQGTQDIGIRMALGAGAGDVLKQVLTNALLLTGAGLAAGLAGAFALLAVVAMVAGFIPARRATRIDPVVALRFE